MVLLASSSPRRRQLLALGHWAFHLSASDIDETRLHNESPGAYVLRLAEHKARTASKAVRSEQVVLAADTAVVDGTDVLGKPRHPSEASAMLRRLRGRSHQVYTGIAALRLSDGELLTDVCITDVPMRAYSHLEIDAYVGTGDPLDKAGGYGIQHSGLVSVDAMGGCFASVMGLPVCHVARLFHRLGFSSITDIAGGCRRLLRYDCPISAAVLRGEQMG